MNIFNHETLKRHKLHIGIIISAMFLALLNAALDQKTTTKAQKPTKRSSLTIPSGYVLVPLTVQNFRSLDQIFGNFGFINLYSQGKLLARNIRAIKTDAEDPAISVLVTEKQAGLVLNASPPLFATLQGQNHLGTEFVTRKKAKPSRLVME